LCMEPGECPNTEEKVNPFEKQIAEKEQTHKTKWEESIEGEI